jgi:hypothetical protein
MLWYYGGSYAKDSHFACKDGHGTILGVHEMEKHIIRRGM